MTKYVLAILTIFSFLSVDAQILKGIVLDSISKKSLQYAHLTIKGQNIGTYSNEDGSYNLNLSKTKHKDTLVVSLIGYEDKKIALLQYIEPIEHIYNFQLVPKTELLDEILINSKTHNYRNQKVKLSTGNRKTTFTSSCTFGKEIVSFIKNPKGKNGKLIDLLLRFKKNINTNYETYPTYFRLYFYNVDTLGFPGERLNYESIIIKPKKEVKTFTIHLEDKHILFGKSGFFVGIETVKLEGVKVKTSMYLTSPNVLYTHNANPLGYSRNFTDSEWKVSYRKSEFRKKLYAVPFIRVNVIYENNKPKH